MPMVGGKKYAYNTKGMKAAKKAAKKSGLQLKSIFSLDDITSI